MNEIKLVCAGDLHLGRLPGGLPENMATGSVSPAKVWRALVEYSIDHDVDAVLLSGDVIDRSNRFFEAFGPLEEGVRRLSEAEIPVVAVAGNHDFDTLPRFADVVKGGLFYLVGRGGRWERFALKKNGTEVLFIDGWSFPRQHFTDNPMDSYFSSRDGALSPETRPHSFENVPTIGLVHGDLDQARSMYAPLSLTQLRQTGHLSWILGHIHKHQWVGSQGDMPVIYPGSPQPLDPGETGWHGAWLVTLSRGGARTGDKVYSRSGWSVDFHPIPVATLRYENVEVDVTGTKDSGDAEGLLIDAVNRLLDDVTATPRDFVDHLMLRITLTGRTNAIRSIEERVFESVHDLRLQRNGTTAQVTKVSLNLRPDRDLEELAKGTGAPAILAQLLLQIQQASEQGFSGDAQHHDEGSAELSYLIKTARDRLAQVERRPAYADIRRERRGLTDAAGEQPDRLMGYLMTEGMRLLDALLKQKEGEAS